MTSKAATRRSPSKPALPKKSPAPPPPRGKDVGPAAASPRDPLTAPGTQTTTRASSSGLRILMVASEAHPFSKTGGLGDVSTSLTQALGRLGHDVTLFTPRYRGVGVGTRVDTVRANLAGRWLEADLLEVPLGEGARAMLVDCPELYDRVGLYLENNIEYMDSPARFAFLSIAALEWAAAQASPLSILHGHDWHTGLLPVYARRAAPPAVNIPSVFTIHNLGYRGIFDKSWVPRLGLSWEDFHVEGFEFWDQLSFLKSGLEFSDALTTVSPTYAQEIQRPDSYGFDGVVRSRARALTGILNGIDQAAWNPAGDRYLPAPFDAANMDGKREAKRTLLDTFGLATDEAIMARPVVGMVSRLVDQKGMDLIEAVAPELPSLDATFVVVGTGEPHFERMWRALAEAYPDRIAAFIGFDERRAHLVEGGADIFLMPSRFEPCGLNQMYSMKYGTVPVVRAVGGLKDTVKPFNPKNGQGTGFVFDAYAPVAMLNALNRAIDMYRQPRVWRRLQTNGMKKDFSWERSAAEYVKVYRRVIAARRRSQA